MRLDIHAHAFHPKVAARAVARLGRTFGVECEGTGRLDDLERDALAAGLDRCVVLCAAATPGQLVPANSFAIAVMERGGPALAFGAVHPGHPAWESELDRLQARGIRGIKIHPDWMGMAMDCDALMPVYEACQGRFIVLLHVGGAPDLPLDRALSSPLRLLAVTRAFPRLDVVAAHFGAWNAWSEFDPARLLRGGRVWLDTSSTSAHVSPAALKALMSRLPDDRLIFGSDWPISRPEGEIRRLGAAVRGARLERLLAGAGPLLRAYGMLP